MSTADDVAALTAAISTVDPSQLPDGMVVRSVHVYT